MRYLELALFAEGPTDDRFLSLVLRRTTEDLCRKCASSSVEVGEVLLLRSPNKNLDLANKILEAARKAEGAYNILFIHTDGAGDPDSAYAQRVKPAKERIATELARQDKRTVGVVPVREMEAWTLVDGDALRGAFGTELDDSALGIPENAREVERILDPKQALNDAYNRVLGNSRRRKGKVEQFFDAIGERVQLDRLRQVSAFQRLEQDLSNALGELGYLRQKTQ